MLRPLHSLLSSHRTAVVTAVLLALTSSPAQAQIKARAQHVRSGFWLSLGAGSGWDIPGTIVPTKIPDGISAFLSAGGSLTPSVDYVYQSFHAGANLRSTHRLVLGTVGLTWH